ncbi:MULTISPECIES: hypothetical protein [unclassified Spirosoma]|uniref:hypothetical protein n=1 Tax=unclassified Spirosoma TaxID=2621999 RepID=UPI00095E5024|nr:MULTISPECIES: hypothetical protein [unclassified Spirosoma]MBN8822479.1 hypothetical protein [Spirosoma sp.]OJW73988.1 MAG: hypothetical protein BGO59_12660 [Spirosoma sp. 48-14]
MVTLSNTSQTQRKGYGLVAGFVAAGLILIPVVLFWYVWSTYAVSIPKWDDHVLRAFLLNFDKEASLSGKLYEFYRQHNEHRIVYDRIITWLDFNLFGKFSYRHLMLVGNLSLLGLIAIFGLVLGRSTVLQGKNAQAQVSPSLTDYLVYLPPVAFLLLNLSQWENMFWGMAALQNFTVLLWVFWTIYQLAFSNRLWPALVLATAATLTSGNGLLVWPVGFAILVLQQLLEKRPNRKAILIWSISAVVLIGLYFLNYQKPPGNPPARGSFFDLIKGWLAFSGAAAEAFPVGPAFAKCLLVGSIATVLALGSWVYLLEKGFVKKQFPAFSYFFFGTTAFLLGTAATVAWSRVGFGLHLLITSRYKIYSLLLLALVYCFIIVQQRKTGRLWVLVLGLVFSAGLMAGSYLTYLSDTLYWRHWLTTHQFNWTHNANNATISIDSASSHYTDLAPAFYDTTLPTIFGQPTQAAVPVQLQKDSGGYLIQNSTLPAQGIGDEGPYLLARSDVRSYLFPVRQNQQSVQAARFLPANLFTNGFTANVPTEEMIAGSYQLFILTIPDGRASLHPTNQTIESAGPPAATLKKNW